MIGCLIRAATPDEGNGSTRTREATGGAQGGAGEVSPAEAAEALRGTLLTGSGVGNVDGGLCRSHPCAPASLREVSPLDENLCGNPCTSSRCRWGARRGCRGGFSCRGRRGAEGDPVDGQWSRKRRRWVVPFPSLRPCVPAGGLPRWMKTSVRESVPPNPLRDFSWFGEGAPC